MPDIEWSLSDDGDPWAGGSVISAEEAGAIIAERLGIGRTYKQAKDKFTAQSAYSANKAKIDLIDNLVRMLPPDALTDTVLMQMDLRPLMQPVIATEVSAQRRGNVTVNGITFTPEQQMLAGGLYVDFQRQTRGAVELNLADAGFPPDQIAAFAREELEKWRDTPGVITPVPTFTGSVQVDASTGQVATMGANGATTDLATQLNEILTGATQQATAPAFLTPDDIRLLFRDETPNTGIGMYMTDLQQRAAYAAETGGAAPPDQLTVEMTAPTGQYGPYMRPGASPQARNQAATGAQSYSLTQALSLPMTMSRDEVATLTRKMEKAGLFAQVGGKPLVSGDPTDPAFKEAYRLLLSKSVQRNRPVSTVLDEDTLAYAEALEENVRARLTDPARLRMTADSLGRELLGRKLTAAEQTALVAQIHGFQRKEAIAESTGTGSVEEVDWEARMQEAIVTGNPGEAGAVDQAAQYDTFRSLLSGPGRG